MDLMMQQLYDSQGGGYESFQELEDTRRKWQNGCRSRNTRLELSQPASCGNRMVIHGTHLPVPLACLLQDDVIH
jgi:hypothetical protein